MLNKEGLPTRELLLVPTQFVIYPYKVRKYLLTPSLFSFSFFSPHPTYYHRPRPQATTSLWDIGLTTPPPPRTDPFTTSPPHCAPPHQPNLNQATPSLAKSKRDITNNIVCHSQLQIREHTTPHQPSQHHASSPSCPNITARATTPCLGLHASTIIRYLFVEEEEEGNKQQKCSFIFTSKKINNEIVISLFFFHPLKKNENTILLYNVQQKHNFVVQCATGSCFHYFFCAPSKSNGNTILLYNVQQKSCFYYFFHTPLKKTTGTQFCCIFVQRNCVLIAYFYLHPLNKQQKHEIVQQNCISLKRVFMKEKKCQPLSRDQ